MTRLLCWLLGHKPNQGTVYLPDIIASLTYCERCGQVGWIERH